MGQALLGSLRLKLDDWRVSQHLKRVEATLRAQDVCHLSPRLRLAREHHINRLHDYVARGVFPRNHGCPGYSPCFIDRDGHECAVAHLVMVSGHAALAYKIAGIANYAYVPQMTFPELDDWAAQSGLSREELALIQPGYWYTLSDILPVVIPVWATGLITVLINARHIVRRRTGIVMPIIGLGVAIVLLLVGLVCLEGATTAYYIGTHPDGFPYDLPLRDVPALGLGVVISAGLALLAGGLGLRRIRDFFSDKRRNRKHIVG